ncbi:spore coat U domain-containing protein [Stenotrophomonas sp. TWI1183]|uniref:Csu type fimbrial protein n=1 Tax=Stenotrophomonas sp. TWI1183 TaxID=3136799 RepID=UPI003208B480
MTAVRPLAIVLAVMASCWAAPARAATTCTATPPTALAFGTITNGAATPTNATTSFTITCNTAALSLLGSASVRACLKIGTGSTGSTLLPTRSMTNATADPMAFQLYTNAARTTVWGAVPGASPPAAVVTLSYSVPLITGGSGAQSVTVYGQIPAAQVLSAGAFTSSFTAANVSLEYAYNESIIGTAQPPTLCTSTSGVSGHKTADGAFPFTVSANVLPQCSTYVTTDMDFGSNAGAISANLDRTSTIGLTCINRTAYSIGLNNGQNASGNVRRMRFTAPDSSVYYIPYELYRDAARSQRWGNTINTDTQAGTGTGAAQSLTVYGRAPPTTGAIPAQGSYNDVITVTITY